jgi:signal transduction histidine kinase
MQTCTHLNTICQVAPRTGGCEECERVGATWVRLRMCLACGHVGCCDESPNKHASAHFASMGHPLIRSVEEGESWVWCYVDRLMLYPLGGDAEGYEAAASEEFLRQIPLFAELSSEDLDRIYGLAKPLTIGEGEALVREGDEGDSLFVILGGEFEVTKRSPNGEVVLSRRGPGEMVGEMSLLAGEPRIATVRALRESRVLAVSRYAFQQLLTCSPSAGLSVLRMMAQRLKSTEVLVAQQEKMAGLGRLTAGLAHELNNPAAAAWRSTDQLGQTLREWQEWSGKLDALSLSHDAMLQIAALREELATRAGQTVALSPLERGDKEYEMETWLESRGIEEAWDLSPVLVGLGWNVDDLERWVGAFPPEHLAVIVPWVVKGAQSYALVEEVKVSAGRISEIVRAVKQYSYLDQAPIQQVDLREGLENTLVILKHKLKGGVEVRREYAPDLPRVEAYASELNQVWTNLIDNAIDAMEGKGVLTVRAYPDGHARVTVEIEDSGPGVPAEIQPRIFQPFFTTKEVGKGTGLGLHIAYNIVVDKHHGQISLDSEPGRTCFRVTLPLELVRE